MLSCRVFEFDAQAIRPVNNGSYTTAHHANSFTRAAWTRPTSWPRCRWFQWSRSHHEQPESRAWWTSADGTTTSSAFSSPSPRTAAIWTSERTTPACQSNAKGRRTYQWVWKGRIVWTGIPSKRRERRSTPTPTVAASGTGANPTTRSWQSGLRTKRERIPSARTRERSNPSSHPWT
jgi:hypothetical protein